MDGNLEKKIIGTSQKNQERDYWTSQLHGDWSKTIIPYDFNTSKSSHHLKAEVSFNISSDLTAKLLKVSNNSDVRLHILLTAGLSAFLYKYTQNTDIMLGTCIYKQEIQGNFINTILPLRCQIHEQLSFKGLLLQMSQTILKAAENQNFPFEVLEDQLGISFSPADDFPLFDVAVMLENIHNLNHIEDIHTSFNLIFSRNENALQGKILYHSSRYVKETIDLIISHYLFMLQQLLDNIQEKISKLQSLSLQEKKQILHEFNDTDTEYPKEKTFIHLFEDQIKHNTDKVAVTSPNDLSDYYQELKAETMSMDQMKKLGNCFFEKAPFLIQTQWHPDFDIHIPLFLIKTINHNCVIVNQNLVTLLNHFDGIQTLQSIYLNIKESHLTFLIYFMDQIDLLEIKYSFQQDPFSIKIQGFNDFISLIQKLVSNHLVQISHIRTENPIEVQISVPIPDGKFQRPFESESYNEHYKFLPKINELIAGNKQLKKVQVLLLGDSPGTPSVGILYLGSYLFRNGIKTKCQFYDPSDHSNSMKENLLDLLDSLQPEIVAISMKWFLYIARVLEMAKIIKEYAIKKSINIQVVVGGNTASYYWEQIIQHSSIDFVIRGDGELPLLKLCQGDENIPNIVFKKDGEIIAPTISYLEDQTHSKDIYLSHLEEIVISPQLMPMGTFFIYTQKGCVMNCLYCGGCQQAQEKIFNRKEVFQRKAELVRKDILAAKPLTSTFQFDFDCLNKKQLEYCREIWFNIDLTNHFCIISCLTLPGEEFIQLVSETFQYIYWDLDICSPSQRHRQQLFSLGLVKPQPSDKEILAVMNRFEKFSNIGVRINLINGLPYFNNEDIETGEEFLSQLIYSYRNFNELHWARLHAQPGAPIIESAHQYGMKAFASNYEEFLKYSQNNFNGSNSYPHVEHFNYPYIYYINNELNSKVSHFYSEINRKTQLLKENEFQYENLSNQLTYNQLNKKANHMACYLRSLGVLPGSIIAILLEPTVEIPVIILGIMKAGASFLPIDPETPKKRIISQLHDSQVSLLISNEKVFKEETSINNQSLQDLFKGKIVTFPIYKDLQKEPPEMEAQLPSNQPQDISYIIFTSGSTGKPKGVAISHQNLVNYTQWFIQKAHITDEDKSLLITSYSFDLGYTALFSSLLKGAELHILSRNIYLSPEKLLTYIGENEISYIKLTPSHLSIIISNQSMAQWACQKIRLIVLGGEAINVMEVNDLKQISPNIAFMNHYGPTEATIGCISTMIDFDEFETFKQKPFIGKPINNIKALILDTQLNLLPINIPGELCIGGDGVGLGYMNRPELTAQRFIYSNKIFPIQFFPLYKTGDRARWLIDGNIEFLGRTDHQVKIRGYRIEIKEIENQILSHQNIKEAAVIIKERDSSHKYLCAYIVRDENKERKPQKLEVGDTEVKDFEEQVKKNGQSTAILSNKGSLTYQAFNQYLNQLSEKISDQYDDRYMLLNTEKIRYKRQMLLHGWGIASQEILKSCTVFVAGAGGGASPTIMQLALAGIGTIIICDYDEVELSNLNRQFLHDESRIGMNKALSAKMTINKINPHIKVIARSEKLTAENVEELIGESDAILDMFDGLQSKFILSQYAVQKRIPHFIAAMTDINAYAAVFHHPHTPCYHCVFDENKWRDIAEGMGQHMEKYEKNPLPVVATSLFISSGFAVNELLKILLGFENPAYNTFFFINQRGTTAIADTQGYRAMTHTFSDHFRETCLQQGFDWELGWRGKFMEELNISVNPHCPVCRNNNNKMNPMPSSLPPSQKKPQNEKIEFLSKRKEAMAPIPTIGILLKSVLYKTATLISLAKNKINYVFLENFFENSLETGIDKYDIRLIVTDQENKKNAKDLKNTINKGIPLLIIDDGDIQMDWQQKQTNLDIITKVQGIKEMVYGLIQGKTIEYVKPGLKDQSFSLENIREHLQQRLPDYMIPSFFMQLETLPLNANNKLDLKALPDPDSRGNIREYVAPRNELENQLAEIWANVLGVEQIGIEDNVFQLGLDSIKAIQAAAKLRRDHLKIEIRDIFTYPTIKEMAPHVKSVDRKIHQIEISGIVQLTPIQQWFFEKNFPNMNHFNMSLMLYKAEGFDVKIVEKVFHQIAVHHDALRMVFEFSPQGTLQRNRSAKGKLFDLEVIEVKSQEKKSLADEIKNRANQIQESINLTTGPLIKLGLFKTNHGDHLLIAIHHLVIDGVSMRILIEDFSIGYRQAANNQEIHFQEKTHSYQYWAAKLKEFATSKDKHLLEELLYWKRICEEAESLPIDDHAGKLSNHIGRKSVIFKLDPAQTEKLVKKVHHAYNTEINDILLTALGMAIKELTGIQRIMIQMEGHGREPILENIDINRTVGWFTSIYPVLLDMSRYEEISQQLKWIKETLRQIPNRGIGFGILKYLMPNEQKENLNLEIKTPISFNFMGEFSQAPQKEKPQNEKTSNHQSITLSPISTGQNISPQVKQLSVLEIEGIITSGQLSVTITFDNENFQRKNIDILAKYYHSYLEQIINHCAAKRKAEKTPSDLGMPSLALDTFKKIENWVIQKSGKNSVMESIYPLTTMQKGFLMHTLENKAQRTQSILTLYGNINVSLFQKSYEMLVQRYDVLRTVFYYHDLEKPLQVLLKFRKPTLHYKDISDMTKKDANKFLDEFKRKDWEEGFNLEKEAMKVALIKIKTDEYLVFWGVHRIILDGWCIGLLWRDFIRLYLALEENKTLNMEPITPYKNYVQWLENQDHQEWLSFWSQYLNGYEQPAQIPGKKENKNKDFQIGVYATHIDESLSTQLNIKAREHQITLNILFQTFWGILLQAYNNREDVVFGATVNGRPADIPGIENMVGLFVNTIPVRIKRENDKTLLDSLRKTQSNAELKKPFEYTPLGDIHQLSPLKDKLIDSNIIFQNYPFKTQWEEMHQQVKEDKPKKELSFSGGYSEFHVQTNFDLNIFINPDNVIAIAFRFNALVYEQKMFEMASLHLRELALQFIQQEDLELKTIDKNIKKRLAHTKSKNLE